MIRKKINPPIMNTSGGTSKKMPKEIRGNLLLEELKLNIAVGTKRPSPTPVARYAKSRQSR
jgi:hypothetical protein